MLRPMAVPPGAPEWQHLQLHKHLFHNELNYYIKNEYEMTSALETYSKPLGIDSD